MAVNAELEQHDGLALADRDGRVPRDLEVRKLCRRKAREQSHRGEAGNLPSQPSQAPLGHGPLLPMPRVNVPDAALNRRLGSTRRLPAGILLLLPLRSNARLLLAALTARGCHLGQLLGPASLVGVQVCLRRLSGQARSGQSLPLQALPKYPGALPLHPLASRLCLPAAPRRGGDLHEHLRRALPLLLRQALGSARAFRAERAAELVPALPTEGHGELKADDSLALPQANAGVPLHLHVLQHHAGAIQLRDVPQAAALTLRERPADLCPRELQAVLLLPVPAVGVPDAAVRRGLHLCGCGGCCGRTRLQRSLGLV
mmetsp:Transcript_98279/g.306628  ORF Transcript_98279/g.306628 Transcript_98279/m.306628 type:complete len:315 (+) Transcript_98279:315-1259(+)